MSVHRLMEMTWTEVEGLDRERAVAILPVGAIEAHGPHLPLSTDHIISEAMARTGAELLAKQGMEAVILPPLDFTAASFAASFPGTISLRPCTVVALLEDVATSLLAHGFEVLAIANSHLDPEHLASLHAAAKAIRGSTGSEPGRRGTMRVVFPDLTRKPWALRLSDEFKRGACHAGQFESSIVMSELPELVRDAQRRSLAPNPTSLSIAIRDGLDSFEAAGGTEAYFGDPAAASAEEGAATTVELGRILADAVLEACS